MKKSEGLYGDSLKGVLIPEVVKHGELEIGRFEVTRAQFAAFDKNYPYDAGTGNFPANGITFEQAKAYCNWLSKITGASYRLPNENEVAPLFKENAHGNENTLDYWAGYTLNPDDAQRLEEKTKDLPGNAPLLKSVGSFAAEGGEDEELMFDLGGSVAEWAVKSDGSGEALGGSANRAADPKARYGPADAQYTGLRVVRTQTH
ncbi:MAG: SUMF1/EgtB/PvdO family nonheme iron enzyme [Candidatus Acidiferrales bacterium]